MLMATATLIEPVSQPQTVLQERWYTAILQYAGFFFVPLLGVFIDVFGKRAVAMVVCSSVCFPSMALVCWAPPGKSTVAAFGIYAFAFPLGFTVIVDSISTSMASGRF